MNKDIRINIKIDKETRYELKKILVEKDKTISEIIRDYVNDYINKNKAS